jgi:hypothetical protein
MDNQFQQFRYEVYQDFNNYKCTGTLMNLVDALSSNTSAKTVVELTLNPQFQRTHTALNKGSCRRMSQRATPGSLGRRDN